jgi:carbamoyltransferase
MPVFILGISAYYHDSAAALVKDGDIVAAAQEERFTRQKGDARFPIAAINYCVAEAGITTKEIDYTVFYEKPLVKFERLLDTYLTFVPRGFKAFRRAFPVWAGSKLHLSREIRTGLGRNFRGQLLFTEHHESHAASAFFPSPFEEAAILTLDAVGEWATTSIGIGEKNQVQILKELRFPHSLGMLYSAFTHYAGFQVNSGEYKLMGLAPYGQPLYTDLILNHIAEIKEDGSLWLDMAYFDYCHGLTMTSEKFHELLGGPPRLPESFITQREMDLAASIQRVCEEIVMRTARYAHKLTGKKNLVMAGGVALNCVANGKLLREGPFENVWVQPAAGDAGGALGSALLVWHQVLNRQRHLNGNDNQKGSFLGPSFSNTDIELFLDGVGAVYEHIPDESTLLDRVAHLLAEEKVIGWFHGRMEYGPRALGCRSIIADARSTHMQQTMNLKIKFRESFRPFAPCVLREFAHEIFEMRPKEESPYMLFVAPVREGHRLTLSSDDLEKMQDPDLRVRVSIPRSHMPAITHVDFSARIQTIDPERHGRFYHLMRRFYDITGCPVIVNTSFNIRSEPIVCSFEEAFHCFMGTAIDCLVLENYLLLKTDQPSALMQDPESYKDQYVLD